LVGGDFDVVAAFEVAGGLVPDAELVGAGGGVRS
jgi:hypothetical protein